MEKIEAMIQADAMDRQTVVYNGTEGGNVMHVITIFGVRYELHPVEEPPKSIIVPGVSTFEVYPRDIARPMSWYDAMQWCKDRGNGWRLPTRGELLIGGLFKPRMGTVLLQWSPVLQQQGCRAQSACRADGGVTYRACMVVDGGDPHKRTAGPGFNSRQVQYGRGS
jgi:hypothetical protein